MGNRTQRSSATSLMTEPGK